jgi:modulator of FtsH protease
MAMYDYPRSGDYSVYGTGLEAGARAALMGKVLSLLGFAFVFTAGGALIGILLGWPAFIISIVGTLGTLLALMAFRERSPLNLGLLYAFATFEGMALGLILMQYVAQGLGGVVVNAALTTAVVTIAAGAYGATTKRDLTGLGGFLLIGLIGVVVASLIGLFVHSSTLYIVIAAVSVLLFTGLLVFDLNRVARARGATEGAAIMLTVSVYLDIVNLFLALLRIFGLFGNSRD